MSGEKTEEPTQKKLRDAREKGQVAYSKDFTQTALIIAIFGYMLGNGPNIVSSFCELLLMPLNLLSMSFDDAANVLITQLFKDSAVILLPFILIVLGVGILTDALQVGILFAFEAIKPSGKKLDVVANAKNIFSKKNLVEFIKSSLKIVFLSILVYMVIRNNLEQLLLIPLVGVLGAGAALSSMMKVMIIYIALAYFVISVADLAFQRYMYRKDNMMTKDEVKREYKEMEGNPEIKHERKHIHQEMIMHGSVENTKNASVLVTNPTHLAIAIKYNPEEEPLPIVLAKGEGTLANMMIKAAEEAGVPIMQNIPLAHDLMNMAQLNQYIPSELIEPVAEVLRLVRNLKDEQK